MSVLSNTAGRKTPSTIVLMGVAGAGKTTVGRALASELRWQFLDADDYHSCESRAKLTAGIALPTTTECHGSRRSTTFLNPALLVSQFDTLEEPEHALVVDAGASVQQITKYIRKMLTLGLQSRITINGQRD